MEEETSMIETAVSIMVALVVAEYLEEKENIPNPFKEIKKMREKLNEKTSPGQ